MRRWLGLIAVVVALVACGGGSEGGTQSDAGYQPPNLDVQPTDALSGQPQFQDAACTTARVGLRAARDRNTQLTNDALRTIDENYAFVFPTRYDSEIPTAAGTVIREPFFERMVALCDRKLGPATGPIPDTVPSVPIPTTLAPVPTQPPPSPAAYDLTGTGTVMVTLSNETGGTEQFTPISPTTETLRRCRTSSTSLRNFKAAVK